MLFVCLFVCWTHCERVFASHGERVPRFSALAGGQGGDKGCGWGYSSPMYFAHQSTALAVEARSWGGALRAPPPFPKKRVPLPWTLETHAGSQVASTPFAEVCTRWHVCSYVAILARVCAGSTLMNGCSRQRLDLIAIACGTYQTAAAAGWRVACNAPSVEHTSHGCASLGMPNSWSSNSNMRRAAAVTQTPRGTSLDSTAGP